MFLFSKHGNVLAATFGTISIIKIGKKRQNLFAKNVNKREMKKLLKIILLV